MKSRKLQQQPSMVEDGAIERLKKRAQDLGLIVNAGLRRGDVTSKTKATDRPSQSAKQASAEEIGRASKKGIR